MDLIKDKAIIVELRRAWDESQVDDLVNRHEEGGYIVLNPDSTYSVERWPRGEQSRIFPPALDNHNRYNTKVVVATFHTHPNPPLDEIGREWEQEPGSSDRRWHKQRRLRGFVISRMLVYEIDVEGNVQITGKHNEVLL